MPVLNRRLQAHPHHGWAARHDLTHRLKHPIPANRTARPTIERCTGQCALQVRLGAGSGAAGTASMRQRRRYWRPPAGRLVPQPGCRLTWCGKGCSLARPAGAQAAPERPAAALPALPAAGRRHVHPAIVPSTLGSAWTGTPVCRSGLLQTRRISPLAHADLRLHDAERMIKRQSGALDKAWGFGR